MKETEKAYLAGIADGEGCFQITRQSTPYNLHRTLHRARFSVGMVDYQTPALFLPYGGHLYTSERNGNRRSFYTWICVAQFDLRVFIDDLLPFLRLKKPHAYRLLEFLDTVSDAKIMSEKSFELRCELYEELAELNRRGNGLRTDVRGAKRQQIRTI